MAFKFSGQTPHRSAPITISSGLDYYTELRAALIAANWTEFYHVGNVSRFRSMKTPQGLQMSVRIAYGPEAEEAYGADSCLVVPYSADYADAPQLPMFLTNARGNHVNWRIIANGYQFFTYSDSDQTFTGGVVLAGVPWIPDFLTPFSIVSVDQDSPIQVTTDRPHDIMDGQYVFVDGVTSYTGLRGTWQTKVLGPSQLEFIDTSGSGSYSPSECVVAGPLRIARAIWAQSCTYAAGWLFNDICYSLRWLLESNPAGGWNLGLGRANWLGFINQFKNYARSDFSDGSITCAGRIHHPLLNKQVYGTKYALHEPWFMMGDSTVKSVPVVIGQLWDAAVINVNPNTDIDITTDDGNFWKIYSWSVTPAHGALLLYLGGT